MPVREHEPVAVRPLRIACIELQVPGEQRRGDVGHAQGHPGMPGPCCFDGIDSQEAQGMSHLADRAFFLRFKHGPYLSSKVMAGRSLPSARNAKTNPP